MYLTALPPPLRFRKARDEVARAAIGRYDAAPNKYGGRIPMVAGCLDWGAVMAVEGGAVSPALPILPTRIEALFGALAVLTGAVIGVLTSFEIVHWTPAQTTLVTTQAAAAWTVITAVAAHYWHETKRQPVAVAGTATAFVAATLSTGSGFSWWRLSETQNASLVSLVTTIIAVASALIARTTVTAKNSG